ncbi:hypothetical protein GQS65_16360 [Halomarina oriensis]|uniref:UspA domain-containing protein n=2 Tax=Halomarina oriensis TaxID=671145 RepID=A0A6B0GMF6_9EURY|nr:hypothetical protein [Halomarina oriensis]
MGTHGRTGVERFVVGSIAAQVVRHAPVPVLTTAADVEWDVETVLVPTDGSSYAEEAADHAFDLAARYDATVHAVSVVDQDAVGFDVRSTRLTEALREQAQAAVDRLVARAEERAVVASGTVVDGHAATEILETVETADAGLVVLGTHGRSGVRRLLLGSVTEVVVRGATVPVLSVPPTDRREE